MDSLLTPHLFLSILGGVIGGFRAAIRSTPPRSMLVRLSDFMVGVGCAVSASHYVPPDVPVLAVVYGMLSGTLTAYALDIAHEYTPKIVKLAARLRFGVDLDKEK